MLTNNFRGTQAISTALTAFVLLMFTGCQPSGPKSLLLGDKYVRQGEYPKALKYLARAAALMPERPQVWNLQGLAYHGLQQPGRAAEAYQRALRIDRNFAPSYYNLGVLLLEQNRVADAITTLNNYVTLRQNDEHGWSRLGAALVRARKTDEAGAALERALKLNPKNADAHNSLGLVHIQRKRPREAMQSFNLALQHRAGYGAALLNQAIVAQQYFGNNQIALERYRAFLNSKPDPKASAAVQLAIRQIEQGSIEAPPPIALADLTTNTGLSAMLRSNLAQQAEQQAQSVEQALTNIAAASPAAATNILAIVRTNPPPAQQPTNPVARVTPTNPPPRLAVAPLRTNAPAEEVAPEPALPVEIVEVGNEPELEAAKDVEIARNTADNPPPPLLAPRRRTEEEKRGFLARVRQANPARWFENEEPKSVAVPPAGPPASTLQPIPEVAPRVATPRPRPVIARYEYRRNLSLSKGNRTQAQKLFAQASAAHQQRRLPEAIALYRQAISADGSFFEARYNLGLAAYSNKDLDLALAANEAAVALNPSSTNARYNFALMLREGQYFADAANELRELLERAPNETRAHLALGNIYAQQLDEPLLARTHYQRFLELAPNHGEANAIRQWLFSVR